MYYFDLDNFLNILASNIEYYDQEITKFEYNKYNIYILVY